MSDYIWRSTIDLNWKWLAWKIYLFQEFEMIFVAICKANLLWNDDMPGNARFSRNSVDTFLSLLEEYMKIRTNVALNWFSRRLLKDGQIVKTWLSRHPQNVLNDLRCAGRLNESVLAAGFRTCPRAEGTPCPCCCRSAPRRDSKLAWRSAEALKIRKIWNDVKIIL